MNILQKNFYNISQTYRILNWL